MDERIYSHMPKITPFLWFDGQAEQAANFYTSVFKNSRITKISRYGDAGPGPKGSVMTVEFELDGQPFIALNGGPQFKFTEAISLSVDCKTQKEVDEFWAKLSAGGEQGPCGWLKDKYGLSWQVNPAILGEMLSDPDPKKSKRVMQAMLKMKKIEIEGLRKAYEQGGDVVVHRAGLHSSEDAHTVLFAKTPKRRTLKDLKEGTGKHMKERRSRR